jgi:hypothetical protein
MEININVSQLINGVITAVINSMAVLIAGRYVARAVERIEKKAVNGNGDKPKDGK